MRRHLCIATLIVSAALPLQAQDAVKPVVMVLIGPPASGKTTQADYLMRKYKIPVFSVEKLIAEQGGEASMRRSDPRVNELVRKAVESIDRSRGFALDGYPASRAQAMYLAKMLDELGLPAPFIVQLDVPDSVVRERCMERGGPEDAPDLVERRLAQYHREMEVVRSFYPEADIWTVDGTRSHRAVSQTIRLLVEDRE